MSEKLKYTNTLDQLTSQVGNVVRSALETGNIEILRAVSDELLRIEELRTKATELLNSKLEEETANLLPGQKVHFGFYEYEKVQKKSASKIDLNKLKEIIKDEDLLDLCFETVKKPLTQAKLSKLFIQNGVDTDVKQLYSAELKNEFVIKPKN